MHKQTFDFFVSAAAIADFTPESEFGHKISSSADLVLKLKPTPKLIEEVRRLKPDITIVAFKAETGLTDQELVEKAYMRLTSSGADLIVANNVSRHLVDQGFASETNTVFIITPEHEVTHIEMHQKRYIASQLIDKALATHILKKKKSAPGNS
jgi:phosphopantothenoylcysteine decarboxylase/phosphopantothenate--cysteine ligase